MQHLSRHLFKFTASLHQSRALDILRDKLPPKLMSGELSVAEVEKRIAERTQRG
jgi:hypothetical protein